METEIARMEFEAGWLRAAEHYQHGYPNQAAEILERLLETARSTGNLSPQLLQVLAVVYAELSRYNEAEELFKEAFALLKQPACARTLKSYLDLLASHAQLYHGWGKVEKAAEIYLQIWAVLDESEEASLQHIRSQVIGNLGDLFLKQGRYQEAEQAFVIARSLNQKLGNLHAELTVAHNLAVLYLALARAEEAEEILKLVVDKMAPSHRDFPNILSTLGLAHCRLGRLSSAEAILKNCLSMYETNLGKEHPQVANACNMIAEIHLLQGKYKEAEGMCRRALSLLEHSHGLDHQCSAVVLSNLSIARCAQGLLDGTEELQQWAVSNFKSVVGDEHPPFAQALHRMAVHLQQSGQHNRAEALFLRILESCRELYGHIHSYTITVMTNLALCYKEQGRQKDLAALSEEAALFARNIPDAELEYGMDQILESLADLRFFCRDYAAAANLYQRASVIMLTRSSEPCCQQTKGNLSPNIAGISEPGISDVGADDAGAQPIKGLKKRRRDWAFRSAAVSPSPILPQ